MPLWWRRSSCDFPRQRRRRPSSRASPWKSCPSRNHSRRSQSPRPRKRRRHRGRRPRPPSRSLHLLPHHPARHRLRPRRRRPPRHRDPSKRLRRWSRMSLRIPSICRHRVARPNKLIRYRPSRSGRHRRALRKRIKRIWQPPPRQERPLRNRRRVRPHHQRLRPNRRRHRWPYRRSSRARPCRAKEGGRPLRPCHQKPLSNHLLPSKSSSLCAKHLAVRWMVRAQKKCQPLHRPRARTTRR
ncbi:hypothetical protein C8J38_102174 [Rhizobium sp. PP-WC-2G-219]|nr:hypothetical protein C8J38_102174 [Rhizobium sp. PP-WC-2G-219]